MTARCTGPQCDPSEEPQTRYPHRLLLKVGRPPQGVRVGQTAHPATFSTTPGTPTTGLRERGNDTSRSTGRSGRQNAATRRNMRKEERVTVQGPVKKQQPDGISHGGWVGGCMGQQAGRRSMSSHVLQFPHHLWWRATSKSSRSWGGAPCAVRKVGCFPPPVAMGPRVLNSAPLMRFRMDHARVCRGVVCRAVPGMNNVIIGAVPALCPHCAKTPPGYDGP